MINKDNKINIIPKGEKINGSSLLKKYVTIKITLNNLVQLKIIINSFFMNQHFKLIYF